MAITPTTQPIKHPVTKSTKIRSPIQPPTSIDSSPNKKKHLKTNKNYTKTENTKTINKFRILEKMETDSSPRLTKPKTQKNKPTNSPEQRTNNEPPNNLVELSELNTIKNV